eukprot:scaffold323_cov414-Prasinococcus_capsulatus_cf.AAC.36
MAAACVHCGGGSDDNRVPFQHVSTAAWGEHRRAGRCLKTSLPTVAGHGVDVQVRALLADRRLASKCSLSSPFGPAIG